MELIVMRLLPVLENNGTPATTVISHRLFNLNNQGWPKRLHHQRPQNRNIAKHGYMVLIGIGF
jgi:hypothetical protein